MSIVSNNLNHPLYQILIKINGLQGLLFEDNFRNFHDLQQMVKVQNNTSKSNVRKKIVYFEKC